MLYVLPMLKINNKILEDATGCSRPQIKRWAVAFLKSDPASGQHSGKARFYRFDEAARIFMGGYLVTKFKYSLKKASQILKDIDLWLKDQGWPIANFIDFERNHSGITYTHFNSFTWIELILYVDQDVDGHFKYRVKEILKREKEEDPENEGSFIYTDPYRLHFFGKHNGPISISPNPEQRIPLSALVETLAGILCYGR